jgi:beta-phosphoglucomutase-like phosphatase (HAD superfamily)
MVEHEKPAPDLYLRAAELIAVPPAVCIAVEDTPSGIGAAKAAGMYAVQVRAASTAFPPLDAADLVIDTLEYFPVAMIDSQR